MWALIGSLIVFGLCFGAKQYIHYHGLGLVEFTDPTGDVQLAMATWMVEIVDTLDCIGAVGLAGVGLSIFDLVAAHRLSLKWALTATDAPPELRGAVALGWCILAASFVNAFS